MTIVDKMLQRGLGFSAEESGQRSPRPSPTRTLQRGLGFSAEERPREVTYSKASCALQRGLGFSAEESRHRGITARCR